MTLSIALPMTTITYGITMQMVAISPLYAHSHHGISGCHAMLIHNMPTSFLIFRSPCQCLVSMVIKSTLSIHRKILVKFLHSEATSFCEFAPPNYTQKGFFIMVMKTLNNRYFWSLFEKTENIFFSIQCQHCI